MPLTSPFNMTLYGAARAFSRVNQDNFGSEFLSKFTSGTTPVECRLKFSHANEGKSSSAKMERHVADITITEYPNGLPVVVYQAYYHIRAPKSGTATVTDEMAKALASYVNTNATTLLAWEV